MIAVAGVTLVAARVAIEIIELEVHAAPVAQAQPGITDTLPADAGLLGGADFVASPAVVAVGVSVGALPIAHALVPARGTAALAALTHASRETLVAARTAVLRVAGLVDTLTVADLVSDRARAITPCADLASRAGDAALAAVARVTELVDALPTTDYLPRRARAHALHAALSGEALVAARAAVGVVAIEIGALAAALVLPGGALADAGHTERPRHTRVRAAAAAAVVRVGREIDAAAVAHGLARRAGAHPGGTRRTARALLPALTAARRDTLRIDTLSAAVGVRDGTDSLPGAAGVAEGTFGAARAAVGRIGQRTRAASPARDGPRRTHAERPDTHPSRRATQAALAAVARVRREVG